MDQTERAIRNLELAGWFKKDSDYGGMIGEAVKKLLIEHQKEGHSGFSHQLAVYLFNKVALDQPLTLEYWQESFDDYNKMAAANNFPPWTEEKFEEIVMKKPIGAARVLEKGEG